MPAKLLRCEVCNRPFWAARIDTKYHNERCRTKARMENAKFAIPKIPKSGVEGVTFNRIRRRWMVAIKLDDGSWKYVGCYRNMKAAVAFKKSLMEPTAESSPARQGIANPKELEKGL